MRREEKYWQLVGCHTAVLYVEGVLSIGTPQGRTAFSDRKFLSPPE